MRERPILFSAPMVRAILEGRKTQTRRILKDSTEHKGPYNPAYVETHKNSPGWKEICGYGKIGDELWVRETWGLCAETGDVIYKATFTEKPVKEDLLDGKWKPSIHMKRRHSRIRLRITDIRVERLQGISEEDAHQEGVEFFKTGDQYEGDLCYHYKDYLCKGIVADDDGEKVEYNNLYADDPVSSFRSLWQKINGEKSWDENPWVWVIEFERIKP